MSAVKGRDQPRGPAAAVTSRRSRRAYTGCVADHVRAPFALLIAVALAALLLAGCSSAGGADGTERDADGLPLARIAARYATAMANDAETLGASMDATFAGEVIGTGEDREVLMGSGREAPLPISVFLVRVEASAGEPAVGSVIKVEQFGGLTSDGRMRVLLARDTAMSVGDRYVFVARQDGPETYSASAFSRFPIEDGVVRAPAGWEATGASRALAGTTPAVAIEKLAGR